MSVRSDESHDGSVVSVSVSMALLEIEVFASRLGMALSDGAVDKKRAKRQQEAVLD